MHSECIFMGLTDEGIDKWLFYFPALLFKEFFHFAKHKDYNSLQMHHTHYTVLPKEHSTNITKMVLDNMQYII